MISFVCIVIACLWLVVDLRALFAVRCLLFVVLCRLLFVCYVFLVGC